GCSRYIGRLIERVAIKPSPDWMQRRLLACGARPINNLVDITNYVLLEHGQPLHAFDFDRLAEGTVLVRRARPDEPITTLDGERRTLHAETLVIADAKRPVAVAGVMGGMDSEVLPQTTRVLLESARFDPLTVRRTARRLGLASESSYRFERGVDPLGVEAASVRAAALIQELAGGREVTVRDVGEPPRPRTTISLDPARMSRWLGVRIDPPAARTTLARLACRVASTARGMQVQPPTFRQDLAQEVDLYEELARLIGYDRIPSTLPAAPIAGAGAPEASAYWRTHALRDLCASFGLTEAVTWSLVSESDLARHGFAASQAARLANPLSQDHAYVRPSLLIGLLRAVRRNVSQGLADLRLFELGSVMAPEDVVQRRESARVGIILSGAWSRDWREQLPSDFVRLAGLIHGLLGRLCGSTVRFAPQDAPWAEPGQAATVVLDGHALGAAGQVCAATAKALDIEQRVWFGELSVETLLRAGRETPSVRTPAAFPPVKRDLSILVGQEAAFEAIDRTIREQGGTLAGRVELIDRYTGKPIPDGKTSLTFSIEYRHPERTLTAAEADDVHRRIGQRLVERFGASLR
ncbi:MAG: phenylalanine--tRNA ligase subunit beta, partial [Candidatus Omnitrophica bacterium]|nr:phenylalanine--tRNA ligase subunit beta [Candidatus Omnitrophota bacterium]